MVPGSRPQSEPHHREGHSLMTRPVSTAPSSCRRPGLHRNDYAIEAVKRYPTRFRVMGKLPLQDPKVARPAAEMEGAAGDGRRPA